MQEKRIDTQRAHAKEMFDAAVPRMEQYGVPLTPENYAVWFEYSEGTNKELNVAINGLVNSDATFGIQTNHRLSANFIRSDQSSEIIDSMQDETKELVDDILQNVETIQEGTQNFTDALGKIKKVLGEKKDIETITKMVDEIYQEAMKVELSNSAMKYSLNTTSKEVDLLKGEMIAESNVVRVDKLTKLPNRRGLDEALEALLSFYRSEGQVFCLLMINIDQFKEFNDTYGHSLGDKVLNFVAANIKHNTKGQDVVARWGGDQFAICLPDTDYQGAMTLADKIREKISHKRLSIGGEKKQSLGVLTVSIGVAIVSADDELLSITDRAEQSLALAKNKGRNATVGEWELFSR